VQTKTYEAITLLWMMALEVVGVTLSGHHRLDVAPRATTGIIRTPTFVAIPSPAAEKGHTFFAMTAEIMSIAKTIAA